MKIIEVISSLGNGGAEKLIVELANELSINNKISLISIKDIEDWMFPPKLDRIPIGKMSKRVSSTRLRRRRNAGKRDHT